MHRTVVLLVVGLTGELVGEATPSLAALAREGAARPLRTILPAVTCSAQSTLVTGLLPRDHGAVANGWYFRDISRGLALAAVEPPGRRGKGLGGGPASRSRLHVRQALLVVQHVQRGDLVRDAAPHVPRRRPQDPRHLHPAGRAPRRAERPPRPVPALPVLGAGHRPRVEPLDRRLRAPRLRHQETDAHARLPPAPRLQPPAARTRAPGDRAGPRGRSTRSAAS